MNQAQVREVISATKCVRDTDRERERESEKESARAREREREKERERVGERRRTKEDRIES